MKTNGLLQTALRSRVVVVAVLLLAGVGTAVASAQTPLSPDERAEIERWNQGSRR